VTWSNSPEYLNLQQHCCKNCKFCSFWFYKRLRVCSVDEQQLASQDRSLLLIEQKLNYWETDVWCWAGAKIFLLCSVQTSSYVSCALGTEGSFSKGDWSGHEEVKNIWSYTTTPSPMQLRGLVLCCAERQLLLVSFSLCWGCMYVWARIQFDFTAAI
jgi:hypothetical protein